MSIWQAVNVNIVVILTFGAYFVVGYGWWCGCAPSVRMAVWPNADVARRRGGIVAAIVNGSYSTWMISH